MTRFGTLLLQSIEAAGLNQAEAAALFGYEAPFINRIVHGHVNPPKKSVESWAKALHLEGDKQVDFILAALATHCPARVSNLMARLMDNHPEIVRLYDTHGDAPRLAENAGKYQSLATVPISMLADQRLMRDRLEAAETEIIALRAQLAEVHRLSAPRSVAADAGTPQPSDKPILSKRKK